MTEKFDAVVVGAGPGGTTAALSLARAGFKIALFERAQEPGQKNMFGGVLHYSPFLNELIPNFWEQAPVERVVTRYVTTCHTSDASLSFTFNENAFSRPPCNGFTILRARFDRWYAQKAEEAGALLIPETVVDDLIREGDRVVGVRTGRDDGDVYADTVILADGVHSLLAEKAGFRKGFSTKDISVAAKEILALPEGAIEERFDLEGNEGLAHLFLGHCTQGVEGGAFLYTNRSSLSIGVVARLSSLQEKRISIAELLETFKNSPYVSKKIKNSVLKEYSGHLIPEAGMKGIPQLYGNGILLVGDAAGFLCSTGLTLQGMNFAIGSGFLASEAFKTAKKKGDFSGNGLACYKSLLEKSFVLQEMKAFRHAPAFLANPRLYETYPAILCGLANRFYRVDGHPKKRLLGLLRTELKGKISFRRLIRDLIQWCRGFV